MITLRPFTEADFPQLMAWIDNERLLREWSGMQFSFPLTSDQLGRYMEGANVPHHSDVLAFQVLDSRTGKPVGHISIGNIDWEQKTGRLSRVLVGCPEARSRGYGQAMVRAIVALGFGALGLHRLGLGAYESNHRALHCYQRCGFQHIGTLRHVLRYEDEYWSSVEMSLQAEDWRRMQGNSGEQRRAWRRNQGRNTSKSR